MERERIIEDTQKAVNESVKRIKELLRLKEVILSGDYTASDLMEWEEITCDLLQEDE